MLASQTSTYRNNMESCLLTFLLLLLNYDIVSNAQVNSAIELTFSVPENVSIGFTIGELQSAGHGAFVLIESDANFASFFDTNLLRSRGEIRTISALDHETKILYDAVVINETGTFFKASYIYFKS